MIEAKGKAAKEHPDCLGEFKKCDKMWNGRPVFVNKHGRYLYQGGIHGWCVSEKFGMYGIAGLPSYQCPGAASKWVYADGSDDQPATISIFCPTHSKK